MALKEYQIGSWWASKPMLSFNGLAVLMSVYRQPGWEPWAWPFVAFGFLCSLEVGLSNWLGVLCGASAIDSAYVILDLHLGNGG